MDWALVTAAGGRASTGATYTNKKSAVMTMGKVHEVLNGGLIDIGGY